MTAGSRTTSSGMRRPPRIISFWCRKSLNRLFNSVFERSGYRFALGKRVKQKSLGNPMCLLCDDEKAYAAYMNYLDAMERQGKAADPDKAFDAGLDALEAAAKRGKKTLRDDPANEKRPLPFFR